MHDGDPLHAVADAADDRDRAGDRQRRRDSEPEIGGTDGQRAGGQHDLDEHALRDREEDAAEDHPGAPGGQ